jgi:hypothetical protein
MPLLTRYCIKTSLIYLTLGLLVGVFLVLKDVFVFPSSLSGLFPVYIHLLVIGWLSQLIFGVAYWMFPVFSREKPRASKNLGWLTYGLLNLGLILRAIAEPWQSQNPNMGSAWLLILSAILQWLAGLMFVFNIWGRVKEK